MKPSPHPLGAQSSSENSEVGMAISEQEWVMPMKHLHRTLSSPQNPKSPAFETVHYGMSAYPHRSMEQILAQRLQKL